MRLVLLACVLAGCTDAGGGASSPGADADARAVVTHPDGSVGAGDAALERDATAPGEPGALVAVSLESTVGILLDDVPEAWRERAAEEALAHDEAFWRARIERQLVATRLRLSYRRWFWQRMGYVKHQLPLPPPARRELEVGAPERMTVDGHDLVGVRYALRGTLLTDPESPGKSEPALRAAGGVWDEPFLLPVDPDLVFQRTGYACLREAAEVTVDGENALLYWDHTCVSGAPGALNCHRTAPDFGFDCEPTLRGRVGAVETALRFERLPWDPALADAVRLAPPKTDTPDLAVIAEGLGRNRIVYRYIPADHCALVETCVGAPGWRRLLQFDGSLENVGGAALHLGAPDDAALATHNVFEYSACHGHEHFRFYGDFEYAGARADKRAFCLLSTTRYGNHERSPLWHVYDTCSTQGIAAGWGDDYFAGIDCQWIDVTDIELEAPLTADLTFAANPAGFLCEGAPVLDAEGAPAFESTELRTASGDPIDRPRCDFADGWEDDNFGSWPVTLPVVGGLVTGPCDRGELSPLRDCGLGEQRSVGCAPGERVTVACSVDSDAPQVVRLCDYSHALGRGTACAAADALGGGLAAPEAVFEDVRCPTPRDPVEVGGRLSVYAGGLFAGEDATVECELR